MYVLSTIRGKRYSIKASKTFKCKSLYKGNNKIDDNINSRNHEEY